MLRDFLPWWVQLMMVLCVFFFRPDPRPLRLEKFNGAGNGFDGGSQLAWRRYLGLVAIVFQLITVWVGDVEGGLAAAAVDLDADFLEF